ncbi:rhomboid family intramembrane serine protease [Spirochaetota bacterium]
MHKTTIIIIAVTTLTSLFAFYDKNIINKLDFSIIHILAKKEIYRMFTSALVHADLVHLGFNMFSLYSFSMHIERRYGFIVIITAYAVSTLSGSLLSLIRNRNNSRYRAVGASGGVCGIIYASIFLLEGGSIYIFPLPIPIPDWLYAVLFLCVTTFALNRNKDDHIGHDAHLGGALAGMAFAIIYDPSIIMLKWKLILGLLAPIIAIPIINLILRNRIKSEE